MIIEKGIALPVAAPGGRPGKYPFPLMEIGDSFATPIPVDKEAPTICQNVSSAALAWAKRSESAVSFTVRVVNEDGIELVRCWAVVKRVRK